MNARSIWQGTLIVQNHEIPVKLYSAVLNRQIHFHLLHKKDRTRVQQRMVDAETEEPVPLDETRRAFEVEPGLFVEISHEEIEEHVPEASREIKISRFVPRQAIEPQLFERPYYLGPAESSESDYFALVQAIGAKRARRRRIVGHAQALYVGALINQKGYLMLITLRNADEVIPVSQLDPPQGRALAANEKQMAEKLIEALSGKFQPNEYRDEYQQRIRELIEAKRSGKKLKPKRAPRRRQEGSLAASLREFELAFQSAVQNKGFEPIMTRSNSRKAANPDKGRTRAKQKEPRSKKLPFHAFWSGSLSFGLVSVPVLVFPATRDSRVHLRLMSMDGSLLERRFYCPRDEKEVSDDEIVRGYELDDGRYILVSDRELESLEPQKSREIDLRQFVDLDELPPMFFERGYYLTPLEGATKAYRLLAEAMERQGRAGIATFVMRDREYLIAIFARDGILCAETLRFHDEIRDPGAIGLSEIVPAPKRVVTSFARSIAALGAKSISHTELVDKPNEALRAIIEKKRKAGRDLVRTDQDAGEPEPERDGDVDLLETIRRSLRQSPAKPFSRRRSGVPSPARASSKLLRSRR